MRSNSSSTPIYRIIALILGLALFISACGGGSAPAANTAATGGSSSGESGSQPIAQPAFATNTPAAISISVEDQAISDGTVTIAEVNAARKGWIVIRADQDGKPGTVLGYEAINVGSNPNVVVTIDASQATETLYAELHQDAGGPDKFEYPGYDVTEKVNGQPVVQSFKVTGGLP